MARVRKQERPGKPSKFTGHWAALRAYFGGTEELAQALGAERRALQRWAIRGEKPSRSMQLLIGKVCLEKGLVNPLDAPVVPVEAEEVEVEQPPPPTEDEELMRAAGWIK